MSSVVAHVEVLRAARELGDDKLERSRRLVDGLALIRVEESILKSAAAIDPPSVRSLDAIHVASAQSVREQLAAMITYDKRVMAAARAATLPVLVPI